MNIGYCSTCTQPNCPTPKIRGEEGVNCSHWTDGNQMPQINEHDECGQCGTIMTIDDGAYPLRCRFCDFELESTWSEKQ